MDQTVLDNLKPSGSLELPWKAASIRALVINQHRLG